MDRQYDYRVEDIPAGEPPVKVETYLRSLGAYGWQLVTVQGNRYFFERVK